MHAGSGPSPHSVLGLYACLPALQKCVHTVLQCVAHSACMSAACSRPSDCDPAGRRGHVRSFAFLHNGRQQQQTAATPADGRRCRKCRPADGLDYRRRKAGNGQPSDSPHCLGLGRHQRAHLAAGMAGKRRAAEEERRRSLCGHEDVEGRGRWVKEVRVSEMDVN